MCVCKYTRNLFAYKIQFAPFSVEYKVYTLRSDDQCSCIKFNIIAWALLRLLLLGVHMHLLTFLCTRLYFEEEEEENIFEHINIFKR